MSLIEAFFAKLDGEFGPLAALTTTQRQIDEDGTDIGVSRQALHETIAAIEALRLALSEAPALPGDLTTPFEPCGVYLAAADILEFVTEDAVVVVRSITPDLDVLLSVDRSRVLGFQVNGASTFGERLALQPRAEESPSFPGREEIVRDGELIDSVLRWACEPTPGDPTLAECIAAHDALERIIALALQPRAEEWRAISEAPRNGTRILTFGTLHMGGENVGERPRQHISYWRDFGGWYCPEWGSHEPTHFRPLPPPPKPEVEG